jgi:hypothetical protein
MPDERPKNFIERLPEILDREEQDISHLDAEMVEILYPDRADRSFTVTVVFGPPPPAGDASDTRAQIYERGVALAQKATGYRTEGSGRYLRHFSSFGVDDVNQLHELFHLVSEFPSCEVLVKGKRVPYGRELWLPLMWFFKKDPLET